MSLHINTAHSFASDFGWSADNRQTLARLLLNASGSAVFDFDNSLICRDIGEASLAELSLHLKRPDLVDRYLALIDQADASATKETKRQFMQHAFNLAAKSFSGSSVGLVCEMTRLAYADGVAEQDLYSSELLSTAADPRFLRPLVFPEMLELCAELARRGVICHIVSASNVWSVRWMALNILNPMLQKLGFVEVFKPENIFGISVLLEWRRHYYSDRELLKEPGYAWLDPEFIEQVTICDQLTRPVPCFEGKAEVVHEFIDPRPFLVVGDSVYDLPMLKLGQNRLWLDKTDEPLSDELFANLKYGLKQGELIVQRTRVRANPGFYSD